jgi:hypothetical protein
MEKIVIAVIGLIAGAVGGIAVAWVNWGIEKRKQKLIYRRELIAKWRSMIEMATFAFEHRVPSDHELTFADILEREADFFSLKPHLSSKAFEQIESARDRSAGWEYRTRDNKKLPSPYQKTASYLVDEIARIEKQWGLI